MDVDLTGQDQVDVGNRINQSTTLDVLSGPKDEESPLKKASLNPVVVLEKLSCIEEAVKLYGNLKKVNSSSTSEELTKSELKRKTWYDENDSLSDISVSDIEISDAEELINPQFSSAEKNREKQSSKPPCKKEDSILEPLLATSKSSFIKSDQHTSSDSLSVNKYTCDENKDKTTSKSSKSDQQSSSDSVSVNKDEKKDTSLGQAEMKSHMSKQSKNVKVFVNENKLESDQVENKDTASLVSTKQEKDTESEDATNQLKILVPKKMDNSSNKNEAESQVTPLKECQRKSKRLLSADSSPFENAKAKQPKLEALEKVVPILSLMKETPKAKAKFSSNMRYELDLHNITTADIGNEAFRKFINLASDCAIQFSNKKASVSSFCSVALYFGDALSLQSAMQKLSQMPVISDNNWIRGVIKCIEITPTEHKDKNKWTKSLIAKMIFQFSSGKADKLRQLYAYKDRKKEGTKRKSAQVHRIPSAMNQEMLTLLFPFSLNIQISDTDQHQKGVKGPVSVEFDHQDWMEAVLTCFQDFVYVSSNQYAKPFYLKIDNFTPPLSPKTTSGDRSRQSSQKQQQESLNQSQKSAMNQSQKSSMNQSQKSAMNQSQKSSMNQSQKSSMNQSQKSSMNQSQKSSMNQSEKSMMNQPRKSPMNRLQKSSTNQPHSSLRNNPKVTPWTRSDNKSSTRDSSTRNRNDTKSRPNDSNFQDNRREKSQNHPDSQHFSNRFRQSEDKVWNERQNPQLSESLESPKVNFYQLALSRGLDPNNKDVIKILEMSVQLEALQALAAQQRAEVVSLGGLNLSGLAHQTVDSASQPATNHSSRDVWPLSDRGFNDGTRRFHGEEQNEQEAYCHAEQILKDNIASKVKMLEELEQKYKGRKREDESSNVITKDSRIGYNVPLSETSGSLPYRQEKNVLLKSGHFNSSDLKSSQTRTRSRRRSRSPDYGHARTSSVHRSRSPPRSRGDRAQRKKESYDRQMESDEQMTLYFIDPAFDPNRNDDPLDFNKPSSNISTEQAVNQDFVRTLEVLKDMKPSFPKKEEKFQSVEELYLPVQFGKNALKKTPKEIEQEKKIAKKAEKLDYPFNQDRSNYIDTGKGRNYDQKNFFISTDNRAANSLVNFSEKQKERGISHMGRGSQDSMNYREKFNNSEKQNISTAPPKLPARKNGPDFLVGGPLRDYSRDNHQSWNSEAGKFDIGERDYDSNLGSQLDLQQYPKVHDVSSLRNRPENNYAALGQHTARYDGVIDAGDARQPYTGKNDFQRGNNTMFSLSQASKSASEQFDRGNIPVDKPYQSIPQPILEHPGPGKQSDYVNKYNLNPGFYEPKNKTINPRPNLPIHKMSGIGTRESETAFVNKFNEPGTANKYSEVSRGQVNRSDWSNSGTLNRNQTKSTFGTYGIKTNESQGLLGERPDAGQIKPKFGEQGNMFDQRPNEFFGQSTEFRNAKHQQNISDGRFDRYSTSYNADAKKSGLLNPSTNFNVAANKGTALYSQTLNHPSQQGDGQEYMDYEKPPRGNLSNTSFNRSGLNQSSAQSARGRGSNSMGRDGQFNRNNFSTNNMQGGNLHGGQFTMNTFSSNMPGKNDFDSTTSSVSSNRGGFGGETAAQKAIQPSKTIPSLFDFNNTGFAGVQGQRPTFPASRGRHGQF